jgi:UDP-N-acetylglucosamine--N-acetylmuramyl-(pentapeptide) pyrophosphoryl-undecaprenol N-acetylglucosamine transferase
VPPVLAARLLRGRPPVILHEQNAVLGRANRFLARHASVLALSFENTSRVPPGVRRILTGNPVRPSVTALGHDIYKPSPNTRADNSIRLLVLGGSLGARVFSDIVPGAIAALSQALRSRLQITQQCRAEDLERVRTVYAANEISAELAPFFPDIADRLRTAHLVIARAGASTVAELAIAGRPSILVPLPGAIDDHQSANARALGDVGAAWVIPQTEFTADALLTLLGTLLRDPAALARSARHAKEVARGEAAEALADVVEQAIEKPARASMESDLDGRSRVGDTPAGDASGGQTMVGQFRMGQS